MDVKQEKPVALVLGGTRPHVDLINNLKARGYFTALIDYLPTSPGAVVCDRHYQESTLDYEKVLELARSTDASLIISACVDQANVIACKVSEAVGRPFPYPAGIAERISSKEDMKRVMAEHGIPTARHVVISRGEDIRSLNLEYPLIVKPVDCTGSKGVVRVDDAEFLVEAVAIAQNLSRAGKAIVEEFIIGTEVQVDYFIDGGVPHRLMTREKVKAPPSNGQVEQSLGSITPAEISDKALAIIDECAAKVSKAYNLKSTPLFIQAICRGDRVSIIEFAPRIGGGLSFRLLQLGGGADIVSLSVSSLLSEGIRLSPACEGSMYGTTLLYCKPGRFDRIRWPEGLPDDYGFEPFELKRSGDLIDETMTSRNRVGAFIIRATSKAEFISRRRQLIESIDVVSHTGESILKKSMYIQALS